MSSDYLADYVPVTPTSFAQPVLDETADDQGGLTGCETPDGHGVLAWDNSNEAHFAVLDSPLDFLIDDIVPLADIGVIMSGADAVYGVSVFSAIGETFCAVNSNTSSLFSTEIYIADNANVPTSWSVYSTVFTQASPSGTTFGNGQMSGTPLILDSGRWVFGTKTQVGPGFGVWCTRIFTSDDDGVTWTQRLFFEHFVFPAGRLDGISGNMALDPITEDIFYRSSTVTSSAYMNIMWRSQDDGINWAHGLSDLTIPYLSPVVHNDTNVYAMAVDGVMYVYDGSGVEPSDWDSTGTNWAASGVFLDGRMMHGTVTSLGIFFFVRDQVMFTPGGGALVLPFPPLYIPFKDRLKNVYPTGTIPTFRRP